MSLTKKLNRSQRLGLDIDKHVAISAGAGTGKTTVMSLRYIEHLLNAEQRATLLLPQSPRRPLQGPGSLRAPKREQQDLENWGGLLPTECVAITFTNDAADQLRQRIREGLIELQDRGEDPRITRSGLIEQMLSLLDDAPIGTIDSFFSSLLAPWRATVSEDPTKEQLSDESRTLLRNRAMNAAWNIRSRDDAFDLGIRGEHTAFIEARDRLTRGIGSRWAANQMLEELLKQSLFVEEAETSIRRMTSARVSRTDATYTRVKTLILQLAERGSDRLDELLTLARLWLDGCTEHATALGLNDALVGVTRYAAFDELVRSGLPQDEWERLQWLHHFEAITTSAKSMLSSASSSMPRGVLPTRDPDWISGLNGLGSIPKTDKVSARENIVEIGKQISALLSTTDFRQLRWMAHCAWLFEPVFACPAHPRGPLRGIQSVQEPLPLDHPGGTPIASIDLQVGLLDDLFVVQRGVQAIMHHMKASEGVHDHSDVQRMAEDLLLARCPDICRGWYPQAVIDTLDAIGEHPWLDDHVTAALNLAVEEPEVRLDLERRFACVQLLRRRFRIFIIDEYQDTNPQQFRLLSRLFGRRALEQGELNPPAGDWDPTVCIVGDLKQSIFRFRQAQVSVMLRTIDAIRRMNREEMRSETRIGELRARQGVAPGFGHDPRPSPRVGGSDVFVTASAFERKQKGSDEQVLSLSLDDDGGLLDYIEQEQRQEGYLRLSKNYRTDGGLLRAMNGWFDDLFDPRHDLIDGEWHARAQSLVSSEENDARSGRLEWLMPLTSAVDQDPPSDLEVPLDPFSLGAFAKHHEREHELLAARLHSLIEGSNHRLLSADDDGATMMPAAAAEQVAPEEIMVLLPKRTHIDDLMARLERWGIPAVADRQGGLLDQPVVRCLHSLLRAVAMPADLNSVAAFTRTELGCFSDSRLQSFVQKSNSDSSLLSQLVGHASNSTEACLFSRLAQASLDGQVIVLLDEILDQSDLLTIFPHARHRQHAEQFVALVRTLSNDVGGDPVLLCERLEELLRDGGDVESVTLPSAGAVRVMTIHAAKGLQSKVVALVGLFSSGHHSFSSSTRSKLIVTPEMMASNLQPWSGYESLASGTWELARILIKSQIQAESRRLLYVALTRVEQHLILVGSPTTHLGSNESSLSFKAETSENPSFGTMLLTALASSSSTEPTSPWLAPAPKRRIELTPGELFHASYVGGGLQSLSVFHSTECFSQVPQPSTPLLEARRYESACSRAQIAESDLALPSRPQRLGMAPHRLDSAGECKRRHWLRSSLGLESEAISLHSSNSPAQTSGFPDPASFGTLFHRLVELGIGNPATGEDSDMPATWLRPQPSRLLETELLDDVITELLPVHADESITRQRLIRLASAFEQGPLGKLCTGAEVAGMIVDGLMTEWPFEIGLDVNTADPTIDSWTPFGPRSSAEVSSFIMTFSGRIDLVLALRSEVDGKRYLMAVDLKTEGSLHGFDEDDVMAGHPLQFTPSDLDDRFDLTAAESEMLESHSLQLSLYDRVLGHVQSNRDPSQARTILTPAIYVAASGRLISWRHDAQQLQQNRLDDLLAWMARASLSDAVPAGVERLPESQAAICQRCPFHLGEIRLCGPAGQHLGLV